MFSDIDKAFCVEAYISTKSFAQARRLLVKKLGWDHRKTSRAPSNATINSWVAKFRDGRLCRRRPGSGRPRSVRSEAMVKKVAESVQESGEVLETQGSESRPQEVFTELHSKERPEPPALQDPNPAQAVARRPEKKAHDGQLAHGPPICVRPSVVLGRGTLLA